MRLRARFTQQQYLPLKKKAVSFNLKSRAEYLCGSRKINLGEGNCHNKKTVPVRGKLELSPLALWTIIGFQRYTNKIIIIFIIIFNWVWLQLDLTTNSSPVVSYYFVSGQGTVAGDYQTLVRRGRWEGERGKEVSFLLPIIPRTSLHRTSLVDINRRLRHNWKRVRI